MSGLAPGGRPSQAPRAAAVESHTGLRSAVEKPAALIGCDYSESSWLNGFLPLQVALGAAAAAAIFHYGDINREAELSGLAVTAFPLLSSLRHILTGLVAGGIGAAVVYPIDVVKTHLQNQDYCEPDYDNIADCAAKICAADGIAGLYTGVVPQVLGVAPQKGLKVSVYSAAYPVMLATPLAALGWGAPVFAAGTMSSMAQAMITNPLEVMKIRLQLQGKDEPDPALRKGYFEIGRELGTEGLYKGLLLTLARDIPSVGFFWLGYEGMKRYFGADGADLTTVQYLISGLVSGAPAAFIATPMDVVKTRWQAKGGDVKYSSPADCVRSIMREEGWQTLWSGALSRVLRISPQLGVTLAIYEILEPHAH